MSPIDLAYENRILAKLTALAKTSYSQVGDDVETSSPTGKECTMQCTQSPGDKDQCELTCLDLMQEMVLTGDRLAVAREFARVTNHISIESPLFQDLQRVIQLQYQTEVPRDTADCCRLRIKLAALELKKVIDLYNHEVELKNVRFPFDDITDFQDIPVQLDSQHLLHLPESVFLARKLTVCPVDI